MDLVLTVPNEYPEKHVAYVSLCKGWYFSTDFWLRTIEFEGIDQGGGLYALPSIPDNHPCCII